MPCLGVCLATSRPSLLVRRASAGSRPQGTARSVQPARAVQSGEGGAGGLQAASDYTAAVEEEEVVTGEVCSLEIPKALSSYDDADAGYEAAAVPEVDMGELSEDEEVQAAGDASYEARVRAAQGDWLPSDLDKELKSGFEEALELQDGMVGNYEFMSGSNEEEAQAPSDDSIERIMAELQQLEAAAAGNRTAVAASADIGEGAGVQDME